MHMPMPAFPPKYTYTNDQPMRRHPTTQPPTRSYEEYLAELAKQKERKAELFGASKEREVRQSVVACGSLGWGGNCM